MEAVIITIGTEILLGEIVDTNTRTIARRLRDLGIDIYLTSTVGDNADRIADAVRASAARADIVITTGGLGPTIDDATREGIASAMGVELEFKESLWGQINERFAQFGRTPTENNRRQALLPAGAHGIENPVGTAPSFIFEDENSVVIALPGVPGEMEHLLESDVVPYLKRRLGKTETILSRVVRTSGIGESVLDERIDDLEQLSNPTVGLSAHPGRVDIRITAKAPTTAHAEEMLWGIQATLEQRLGRFIYGIDDQSLEGFVLDILEQRELSLATMEYGTGGLLANSLSEKSDAFITGEQLPEAQLDTPLETLLANSLTASGATVGLALMLTIDEARLAELEIIVLLPGSEKRLKERYPSLFVNMEERAVSFALDLLRRALLDSTTGGNE